MNNNTVNSADVLGGEAVVDSTVATTPGSVARNGAEKRKYTKRGTSYPAVRVVLFNGTPIGRGAPKHSMVGKCKVVYIIKGMTYDPAVHGEGVKFNVERHPASGRRINADDLPYTWDAATKTVTPKPQTAPAPAPTKKKGAKSAKSSKNTTKATKKSGKVALTVVAENASQPIEASPAAVESEAVAA
jgi:hypothetical protein